MLRKSQPRRNLHCIGHVHSAWVRKIFLIENFSFNIFILSNLQLDECASWLSWPHHVLTRNLCWAQHGSKRMEGSQGDSWRWSAKPTLDNYGCFVNLILFTQSQHYSKWRVKSNLFLNNVKKSQLSVLVHQQFWMNFGWSETEAVFNWSMIMSATGICSFASYLLISRLNKRFGEKNMCNL